MEPEPDPERHLKKLAITFGVTNKIAKLAKNRPKSPKRTAEEIEEELLTKAKERRENRVANFGPIQRHIFGLVAKHYNISIDDIVEGVADSDEGTDILRSFCSKNGHSVIVFLYSKLKCPGEESGRYDYAKENLEEMRVTCTDGYTENHCGHCVAICRQQTDTDLDMKAIVEEISVEELYVDESETLKSAIERFIIDLNLPPNVQLRKEKAPPVEGQAKILRIEYDLEHLTDFEVNHNLFKGHLLVPFQIKETSRKRELVEDVKTIFDRWLQQIRIILIQDKQITRDSNKVGPSDELIYWQKKIERYKQISEFIASRPFINHLTCLQYTRAKLLKKWKSIEEEFNALRSESENNVKTLEWLKPFWDPLYTGTPTENCEAVNRLVCALRDKYNDSANYNRSECMTSFLVKATNQLVISCRYYLNNKNTLYVLKQEPSILLQKISVYSPEICARTSLIDFAVTMQGLEDQLLSRVIMHDKRQLEEERTNIIITMSTNRRKIKLLEENLLKQLSMSTGNLLDDINFINTLNASKATANDMKEKLITARNTEMEINAAREDFRAVATRGSVLYFLVCAMADVNVMYQTSLNQFLERFDVSLSQSKRSHNNKVRIADIMDYLTFEIFSYKSRGLFESHKFLFALLLALKIDLQKGDVTYEEFQTFVKGGAALNLKDCPKKPFAWITDMTWLNLVQLTVLRPFVNILKKIGENENVWKRWFQKPQPEIAVIPDEYQKLDVFRKLLLIRAWCPDRTYSQSRKYIAWSLGERFVEPLILNYNSMVQESKPLTPLICFLSMGSDPTMNIQSMAKKYDTTVKAISMGQGQEVHARALLSSCLLNGSWTLLQNCHLGLDYMNELVVQLKNLETNKETHHDKFRLWITTEVHTNFPITLLQQSIKFTNDPPSGIRAGLERTYGTMSQDFLDYSDSPYYLPLIYAVSFMHTVLQERRKFGPIGWNIPYEFNSSDWQASCTFMQNHLDDIYPKREICWNTIRYMLGEIQYGGRVTDDCDKRLLNTFAKVWFSNKLFNDDFQFCPEIPKCKIESFKLQEEYLQAFSMMETVDEPQVYGLHSNDDIAYQTNTTNAVLDTILSIEPKDSSGGVGESRESFVNRIANDMLQKLPPIYDPFEMREKLRDMGMLNPMVVFLRQELDRMRMVLMFTRITLSELLLAIDGTIIMNEELQNAFDSIFDAKVQRKWLRKSCESSTLGFWFTELIDRNKQFSFWLFKARPKSFCLSGFFNPQGFLTAVRQETTRANLEWALDEVTLQNDVTKMYENECKIPPKAGVYVHGLYLDGASWDLKKGIIAEAINKVLYKMMPVINIFAVNANVPPSSTMYECPVYKIVKRTNLNYITSLRLNSDKPSTLWIQRGVALLCDVK